MSKYLPKVLAVLLLIGFLFNYCDLLLLMRQEKTTLVHFCSGDAKTRCAHCLNALDNSVCTVSLPGTSKKKIDLQMTLQTGAAFTGCQMPIKVSVLPAHKDIASSSYDLSVLRFPQLSDPKPEIKLFQFIELDDLIYHPPETLVS